MKPVSVVMYAAAALLGAGWLAWALAGTAASLWLWWAAAAVLCLPLLLWLAHALIRGVRHGARQRDR